ncbi:glycine/serine hydroxymethyltransferase [Burkholderiales bacterium JOSHI_001]|nr:glycine/serine hydroxymethyltransferase [Burkholderiales bacterium JOSHI_001]
MNGHLHPGYFSAPVEQTDPLIAEAIAAEARRQEEVIELIASENIVSRAVLQVQGSLLTNKTVEGYPGKRWHAGAAQVDKVERAAIERACALFGCNFANVQPHSGSQANHAVLHALLQPGDTLLSMDLNAGGHLSHGAAVNFSGRWFKVKHYGVRKDTGLIDPDEVMALAREHKPKLVIAGGSAYPRALDFPMFRRAADAAGAKLLVDMAHFAGLVAGGAHASPFPHADVVTTTTYKSLRGPRGAIVLWNDPALSKPLNTAVFPGLQGTPYLHIVAAKAVALGEALKPEFKAHAAAVLANARALAAALQEQGFDLLCNGTDTPLMLLDLRRQGLTGDVAAAALERCGLIANLNPLPTDDPERRQVHGVRFGVSGATTRGLGVAKMGVIAGWTRRVLGARGDVGVEAAVGAEVRALARGFPLYRY